MKLLLGTLLITAFPLYLTQLTWLLDPFGKFDVKEIRMCPDQGTKEMIWDLRLNRQSRQLVVVEGNISMKFPLDNNIMGNILIAERGNGGWMEQTFVFKMNDICADFSLLLQSGWTHFWEKAGVPRPIRCPIKQGNYTLTNFPTTEFEKNTFPGMKQGVFRVDLEFLKKKDRARLGCTAFFVNSRKQ